MAQNQNKTQPNRGQQQMHRVRYPDGSEGQMSQTDWQNRDKAAGVVRVDEDGNELPETETETDDDGA